MANPSLLLALRARVRRRKAKKRTVPKLRRPSALSYSQALLTFSRSVSAEIRKEIFAWMDSALTVDNGVRLDAPVPVTLTRTIEGLRAGLMERARKRGETIATKELTRAERENRGNMNAQFKSLIGVDVFKEPIAPVLNRAIASNVDLIVTIPQRQLGQVEKVIREGIHAGLRVEELKKQVEERFAVSESRAQLIARDQVNKLNGELVETRNKALGIKRYTWATSQDERVRGNPTGMWPKGMHWDLDGKVFSWDDPPVTNEDGDRNHPGSDYMCRCSALPDVEGLLESLDL